MRRRPSKGTAPKRSSAEWRRLVASWRSSGLDAEDFAEQRGVSAARLSWWAWRFGRDERAVKPPKPPVRMVPIRIEAPDGRSGAVIANAAVGRAIGDGPAVACGVEVVTAQGHRMVVPGRPNAEELRVLVEALVGDGQR